METPALKENAGPEAAKQDAEPAAEPRRQPALTLLVVLAVVFVLHWAQDVFIPLMLGLLISYALSPVVNRLEKWHIPRAIGAAVLLLGIVGGAGTVAYSLRDDAAAMVESLPEAAQKLRRSLSSERGSDESTMDKVQKAATQLERAAAESGNAAPSTPRGVMRVQIEKPLLNIKDYFWPGTLGMVLALGKTVMVLFLAYFLLVSGDMFRRKLVRISGTTLAEKRITVQVLDEITEQIQRFLLVQVFTSVVVGVVSWLAFLWIGLEHPAVWGIAAGLFNSIPYLGPIIVFGGTGLVALLQFGTLSIALGVAGVSLVITGLEGYLLTPWLTGRATRMNAVVVFAGVLFWGWLWGPWGLLLGVPIIMIIKVICDHVEDFKPVGELLGD